MGMSKENREGVKTRCDREEEEEERKRKNRNVDG